MVSCFLNFIQLRLFFLSLTHARSFECQCCAALVSSANDSASQRNVISIKAAHAYKRRPWRFSNITRVRQSSGRPPYLCFLFVSPFLISNCFLFTRNYQASSCSENAARNGSSHRPIALTRGAARRTACLHITDLKLRASPLRAAFLHTHSADAQLRGLFNFVFEKKLSVILLPRPSIPQMFI